MKTKKYTLLFFLLIICNYSFGKTVSTVCNGYWSNPSIWSGNAIPASNDTIIVDRNIRFDADITLDNNYLIINSSAEFCGLYQINVNVGSYVINNGTFKAQGLNLNDTLINNNTIYLNSLEINGFFIDNGLLGLGWSSCAPLPNYLTLSITSCSGYQFGGKLATTSGTYFDTLSTTNGCDSVITLHLTINKNDSSSMSVIKCDNYLFGGNLLTASGTYYKTLKNVEGCDSVVTLHLTISPLNTSINKNGNILTSNATGATYKWINCIAHTTIGGATSQSFTATTSGNYAVIVTNNGCSDTSACVNIYVLGIDGQNAANQQLTIYPNPNEGRFTITLLDDSVPTNISILDFAGRELYNMATATGQNEINLNDAVEGVYILKIATEGQTIYKKIIVN